MRQVIRDLPGSKIREVANAALGRDDVLPFWFGESDEATPPHIRDAAVRSLAEGETFYSHNLGVAELREALARYVSALHRPVTADRIAVTSSGVSALMLAMQALVGAGDEVVAVTPVWPNLTAQPAILGAGVTRLALRMEQGTLAARPRCPAPGRDLGDPRAARQLAEQPDRLDPDPPRAAGASRPLPATGTWIVADEVYERVFFAGAADACAPSFLDIAEPDDRLLVVHSFSKSFLMTGWRLGWIVAPPGFTPDLAKLIEFNTSCAPVFVQRAALAALAQADASVPELVGRLRPVATRSCPVSPRCPGSRSPRRRAASTPSSPSRASPTPWRWPSGWSPRPGWAWPRGRRSGPRGKVGCAGASPRATRHGWSTG